jgi:hypothetical protein
MGQAMLVSRGLIVAAAVLASQTAEAQQPTILTLACRGTITVGVLPSEVSMGIIVNFDKRAVQGFDVPRGYNHPVLITGLDDLKVSFGGSTIDRGIQDDLSGSIDRVTGDVAATEHAMDLKSRDFIDTVYALRCKTTQRMF